MGGIYGEICTKKGIYQRKWRLCGIILHGVLPLQGIRPDLYEMDLTAAESKATYEEIKKDVAEHNDGMKVSNLYIAQVKRKCGIIERENNNKSKSEKGGQPECPKEKEIAIEEALKYFQMIPSES